MHFPSGHLEDAFHEGAPPGDVQNDDGDMIYVTKEVELRRQAQGFGFRLVGGHEEGTQVIELSACLCACMCCMDSTLSFDYYVWSLGVYRHYCSRWCCRSERSA